LREGSGDNLATLLIYYFGQGQAGAEVSVSFCWCHTAIVEREGRQVVGCLNALDFLQLQCTHVVVGE
jgi:hypothetical protein